MQGAVIELIGDRIHSPPNSVVRVRFSDTFTNYGRPVDHWLIMATARIAELAYNAYPEGCILFTYASGTFSPDIMSESPSVFRLQLTARATARL